MASKREASPSLRMRKIVLVICEGETEVGYINLFSNQNSFAYRRHKNNAGVSGEADKGAPNLTFGQGKYVPYVRYGCADY